MRRLWFKAALLESGWAERVRLTLDDGTIARIETDAAPEPDDERGGIALPGLCNVHSHGFQRGMAGLTEYRGPTRDNFWTWRQLMYRFLDRLAPADIEAITAQAYVEMLESGSTRVGEFHSLHHDVDGTPYHDIAETAASVAAAAEATGIGLTLLPVFYAHGGFGGQAADPGQRRFLNDVDRFARLHEASRRVVAGLPGANIGVAPHSLRAVTPEELRRVIEIGGAGPVHIHAAEQTGEVEHCLEWSGARPVEWLLDNAGVDARWCLIHATHLDAREIERLAASGAVAGLCPITEANLGDGVFPAEAYLAAGGAFGVGSDSNIIVDAARELAALENAQRLVQRARNVLAGVEGQSTGMNLFRRALAGGARSLGAGTPTIAVGADADLVELDEDHLDLVGRRGDQLIDAWVFAAGAGAVASVWRRGRKLVEGGRHVARSAIADRYKVVLRRLLAD